MGKFFASKKGEYSSGAPSEPESKQTLASVLFDRYMILLHIYGDDDVDASNFLDKLMSGEQLDALCVTDSPSIEKFEALELAIFKRKAIPKPVYDGLSEQQSSDATERYHFRLKYLISVFLNEHITALQEGVPPLWFYFIALCKSFDADGLLAWFSQEQLKSYYSDPQVRAEIEAFDGDIQKKLDFSLIRLCSSVGLIEQVMEIVPKYTIEEIQAEIDSLLFLLIKYNELETLEYFLTLQGLDINKKIEYLSVPGIWEMPRVFESFKHQYTPLMYAAKKGNKKAVSLLLQHPDINIDVNDSRTARDIAREAGHDEIVELLEQYKAQNSASLSLNR